MSQTDSLGVLLPTRDSMALLPLHLSAMQPWLDLAEEIIVVDSFSTDDTLELLRRELPEKKTRFYNHPRGLYQSWNYGIRQMTAKYCYISTVGETIQREGLENLRAAAESLRADVIISKPVFCYADGRPAKDLSLPIDDIIDTLKLRAPSALEPLQVLVFAIAHADAAMLGSSASDLYRTRVLQQHPFPTDHALAGDAKWGVLHACDVRWAVLTERVATYLQHPLQHDRAAVEAWAAVQPASDLARGVVERLLDEGRFTKAVLTNSGVLAVLDAFVRYDEDRCRLNQLRHGRWPWFANPAAWPLRWRRQSCRYRLEQAKLEALRRHATKKSTT